MLDVPPIGRATWTKACSSCTTSPPGVSFLPEEIEKERGVVLEEWRGRLGANSRLTDKQLPIIFQGSRYADRLPIGLPDILKSAPRERLLAFYQKWYRPDRMAVVVVGDIATDEAERLIQQRFSVIPAASGAAAATERTVPPHRDTLVSMATDSEAQGWTISIGVQARRRRGRNGSRLSQVAGGAACLGDAESSLPRNRASAKRPVPRGAGRWRRHRSRARAVRVECRRSRRSTRAGPRDLAGRSQPDAAIRLQCG